MSVQHFFIEDTATGYLRVTQAGIVAYAAKFAKAGYDIRRIRTRAELEAAVDASFACEMRTLAASIRGDDPELDRVLQGLPGWDD